MACLGACSVLEGTPVRNGPLLRFRRIRKNNNKMNFERDGLESVHWLNLA